ncbi:MAG: hypothetical protein QM743_02780 [Chitinophagaceae bacterium]
MEFDDFEAESAIFQLGFTVRHVETGGCNMECGIFHVEYGTFHVGNGKSHLESGIPAMFFPTLQ